MNVSQVWQARRSGALRHGDDVRSDFEVDYARVVHSGSFRRLQGKTQILSLGDDDFYRTRLTHSLEVAQVGEGLVQHLSQTCSEAHRDLLPSGALIRAIGLAHDIGHPPFGHGGELALNYCMRDDGGFEGNAQTFRLLTRLEAYSAGHGADLTRRTLLGILKYPVLRSTAFNPAIQPKLATGTTSFAIPDADSSKPVKACYDADRDEFDWVLEVLSAPDRDRFVEVASVSAKHGKATHKSFDCSIMDAADDIAYGVHDLEDALALGLVEEADLRHALAPGVLDCVVSALKQRGVEGVEASYDGVIAALFGKPGERKRIIGRLVHYLIRSTTIHQNEGFVEPLLATGLNMHREAAQLLNIIRDLISAKVINSAQVQHLDFKGQRMVVASVEALMSAPASLLPSGLRSSFVASGNNPRIICDYVACMTDAGLLRLYDRLFSPRMGTIFDRF